MKLFIRQKAIPEELIDQLGYKDYLKLFEISPNIKSEILDPMEKDEGILHYRNLNHIRNKIVENNKDISELIRLSSEIPHIDSFINHYENGNLSQYHLFELGHYISSQKELTLLEKHFPIDPDFEKWSLDIEEILESYTEDNYRKIRYDEKETLIRDDISRVEKDLKHEISNLENDLYKETKIRFIYPYPLETEDKELAERVKNKSRLNLSNEGDIYTITIKPTGRITGLQEEKKHLLKSLDMEIEKKILRINSSLLVFFETFNQYIHKRNFRTFQYVLIGTAEKNNLCFPVFNDESSLTIKKGRLHQLELLKREKTVPLDIRLKKGSSVLFGANMSGKTTVLKTIYFIISLIRFGLPVPAEEISLDYPDEIDMNLKSSGDISKGESGFSIELGFLTKKREGTCYVLCDELFMTTDPLNGAKLSCFFLDEIKNSEIIFLASSHYTEVTEVKDIDIFMMKDADIKENDKEIRTIHDNTPYEVQKVERNRKISSMTRRPLEIALHFPLQVGVKDKIEEELKKDIFNGEN